jgi:hypothetical protein
MMMDFYHSFLLCLLMGGGGDFCGTDFFTNIPNIRKKNAQEEIIRNFEEKKTGCCRTRTLVQKSVRLTKRKEKGSIGKI